MRSVDIVALLRAHRDRARPVAFFHVLRQPSLEADDHAFLSEHIGDLGISDLLRWRARCEKGETAHVIRRIADLATGDVAYFQHELLDAPRLTLQDAEWDLLAELLRGKVDDEIHRRILAHGARPAAPEAPRPAAPPQDESFGADDLLGDLGDLDGDASFGASGGGESLSFFDDLDDGAGPAAPPPLLDEPPAADVDWSPSVVRFKPSFRDAVLERAKTTPRGDERAVLLEWLGQQDVSKKQLIQLLADAVRAGLEIGAPVIAWLSRQLADRAAWDHEGSEILAALIERRAFTEITDLMTYAVSDAGEGASDLLTSMRASFATSLLRVTRESIEAKRPDRAMAALSALACLEPTADVASPLKDLRGLEGAGEEIKALVALNERQSERGGARAPSLEGIVAAVHALADAFG